MTIAPALAIVVVVVAAIRLVPGLLWRRRGMDAGYHLLLRREIRRHGMRMPARVEAMALDARQTYPWGFHYLLALLPDSWIRAVPPLPSTLIDCAHALLVSGLACVLAPQAVPAADPAQVALLAGLLFGTAPALLVVGIGPRAFEITPRPLGELFFSALMIAGGMLAAGGGLVWAGIAAVAGGCMLMSSKFAAQVLLACAVPCALVAQSYWPVLLVPIALAGAMVVSGGRYRWVLEAHVRHLAIFRQRLQHEHPVLLERNDWGHLVHCAGRALRSPGDAEARLDLARVAEHNTILQFLLRNVLWIGTLAAFAIGWAPTWPAEGEWRSWLLAWSVAPLVPFAISSVRRWRFLGEAERYPEYAIAPIALLAAMALAGAAPAVRSAILTAYGLLTLPPLIYSAARQRWNAKRAQWGPELDELIAYLRTQPPSVILPVPWLAAYVIAPEVEHRFLAGNDGTTWQKEYDRFFARYPWPTTDLAWWRERYGAQLAIVESGLIEDAAAVGVTYRLDGLPLRYANARFQVYGLA